MEFVSQDILTVSNGVIVHSVNRQGAMGAGLAKDIRERWPTVYDDYRTAFRSGNLKLGLVVWTVLDGDLAVASVVGQDDYGRTGRRYTDYNAIRTGLQQVLPVALRYDWQVYIPYGMGCGLGGGDWGIISEIIEEIIPRAMICHKD